MSGSLALAVRLSLSEGLKISVWLTVHYTTFPGCHGWSHDKESLTMVTLLPGAESKGLDKGSLVW